MEGHEVETFRARHIDPQSQVPERLTHVVVNSHGKVLCYCTSARLAMIIADALELLRVDDD